MTRPPARTFQPEMAPGRLPELTLETDLLGGFDDNLNVTQGAFLPGPSGYTGFAATRLRYEVGRPEHSLVAQTGGWLSSYRLNGVSPRPTYGGDLMVRGRAEVGRNTALNVSQSVLSDPFLRLRGFNPLQTTVSAPANSVDGALDSGPVSAITEARSLSLGTQASVRRDWTTRTSTNFSYRFHHQAYNKDTPASDSRRHEGQLSYDRSVGRSSGLEASYRYSDFESVTFQDSQRPTKNHTLEFGFRHGRNLSGTRRVEVSAGGGPMYVETVDNPRGSQLQFWAPSAHGTASVDLGRVWALNASYRRRVRVLEGLSAQAFLTHAARVSLGGLFTNRIELVFSGAYLNGSTGGVSEENEPGAFDSYALSSQVSVLVTRWWSAMASYTHYRYTLNAVARQSLLLPPRLNRNAVFFGFTLRALLVGALP